MDEDIVISRVRVGDDGALATIDGDEFPITNMFFWGEDVDDFEDASHVVVRLAEDRWLLYDVRDFEHGDDRN